MMTHRPGGWTTRRPYLIWAYDYDVAAGGGKMLHRLCHELRAAGEDAYVVSATPEIWTASPERGSVSGLELATNPEWDTPVFEGELDGMWTAVYPEIVPGNPWGAPQVARWVLNLPGRLGGDRSYAPDELVFAYHERFYPGVPLLCLPWFDPIYADRGEPREGAVCYIGKSNGGPLPEPAPPITLAMRRDPQKLAAVLNRAERMYSFDEESGMIYIARLCGCPVTLVRGDGLEELPSDTTAFHAAHRLRMVEFREQLGRFIEITQGSRATTQGRKFTRPTPRGLPSGSAYSERHQGSSYGYERP